MSVQIPVLNKSSYFEVPITVQFGYIEDDGEFVMEYCNHAGAEPETYYNEYPNLHGPDLVSLEKIETCDKCPAWRPVYSDTDDDYFYGETRWQYDY